MATLDIAMPLALFFVSTVALLLNERTEGKLKTTFEEREFGVRDVVLLVLMIVVVVSVIAYISLLDPGKIFQNVMLIVFVFAYSVLLFIFSYLFSGIKRRKAQLLSFGFGFASLLAGAISLLEPFADGLVYFRTLAFFGLAAFSFSTMLFEARKSEVQERWYLAIQPPALFVLLFVFFNVVYDGTPVWYPILLDVFALTFAVLIVLYLGSLFTWKTVLIFASLLTIVDIILVLVTGSMVVAAQQFTGLGLPVLVYLPNVPLITAPQGILSFFGFLPRGLGLGDFFFAGILALQTFKRFGKQAGYTSIVTMTISFAVFEAFLPEIAILLEPLLQREIGGFPGTLMIVLGWLPVVAWRILINKMKKRQ